MRRVNRGGAGSDKKPLLFRAQKIAASFARLVLVALWSAGLSFLSGLVAENDRLSFASYPVA
jgi:hypothetical protein